MLAGAVCCGGVRAEGERADLGDLAVFKDPGNGQFFVNRVLARGGDRIALNAGVVEINQSRLEHVATATNTVPYLPAGPAQSLPRCFSPVELGGACVRQRVEERLTNGRVYSTLSITDTGPGDTVDMVTVPEGEVFLLGVRL